MKKFCSLVLMVAMMAGCVSTEVKQVAERNAARSDAMVQKIEKGETTRAQEQNFIRAMRPAFHSMNWYLNDAPLPDDLKQLEAKLESE